MVLWNDVVLVVLQYVEGGKMRDLPVDNRKLLWQATSGLHHLHSLGIGETHTTGIM